MTSNTDPTLLIYSKEHMRVKVYLGRAGQIVRYQIADFRYANIKKYL